MRVSQRKIESLAAEMNRLYQEARDATDARPQHPEYQNALYLAGYAWGKLGGFELGIRTALGNDVFWTVAEKAEEMDRAAVERGGLPSGSD